MPRLQDELDKPTGSLIGRGLNIQAALITGTESVRVDGAVVGNIDLDGALHLSETGYIEGDLRVSSARISGQVSGNVFCHSLLHLASTAKINGDINTVSIIVDEGASIRGRCKTGTFDLEAAAAAQ